MIQPRNHRKQRLPPGPGFDPDLDNEIHEIFRYENFRNLTKDEYDTMKLAFQLASKLLTDEHMLQWWLHAAFDKAVQDANDDSKIYLVHRETYTREQLQQLTGALVELAEYVEFDFKDTRSNGNLLCGITRERRGRRYPKRDCYFPGRTSAVSIDLHYEFCTSAGRVYRSASLEEQLRYSFFLGTTLVHELTHAFCILGRQWGEPNNDLEPHCSMNGTLDRMSEMGCSWEINTIGMMPFTRKQLHLAPLTTLWGYRWTEGLEHGAGNICDGYKMRVLPILWILQWFRRSKWEELAWLEFQASAPMSEGSVRAWTSTIDGCTFVEYPKPEPANNTRSKKRTRVDADDHGDDADDEHDEPRSKLSRRE